MADGQMTTMEERASEVALTPEADSLMGALITAASDADPDKMERLLSMYERIEDRKAKKEFDIALAEVQNELPEIGKLGAAKDSKGKVLYNYGKWEDINRVIKPILAEHGFSLSFRVADHERGLAVTGVLSRSGHSEETTMTLPLDSASAAMSNSQARGSATSYGKRYTAGALLNLILADELDNDGVGAPPETVGPEEMTILDDLLKRTGADRAKFFAYAKVEGMADIYMKNFEPLKKALEDKLPKEPAQ